MVHRRADTGQTMLVSSAKALVGKIVTLELVGGIRVTTKVAAVERDSATGQFYLCCGQLLVFLMQQREGSQTGRMGFGLVGVMPYGVPEMVPQKTNVLALDHIVLAQPAMDEFATVYAEET